jgi:hypothetical protein
LPFIVHGVPIGKKMGTHIVPEHVCAVHSVSGGHEQLGPPVLDETPDDPVVAVAPPPDALAELGSPAPAPPLPAVPR